MTCRHSAGDPSCSSRNYSSYNSSPPTPDSKNFNIIDAQQVGNHLVLKVKYPNCFACAFEGVKVLVFLNTTALDALKFKEIDPHFRDVRIKFETKAPPPAARFPASEQGFKDAIEYAKNKP